MKTSAIRWTDYSGGDLNFVTGCTPVSEGCKNCYAAAIYKRFKRDFSKVTIHPEKLRRLVRKRFPQFSLKRGAPYRPMCFVVDTGDLFHEDVPDEFLRDVFFALWRAEGIAWQILTKRPLRAQIFLEHFLYSLRKSVLPDHIWLGVSVSNQRTYDERRQLLLDTPAAVRFVSVEPMLEEINLRKSFAHSIHCKAFYGEGACNCGAPGIDWIIVGAESGPNRRPFDVAWAADIKRQCDAAGVAYFGKQGSGLRPGVPLLIDGRTWHEWPGGTGR